MRVLLINQSNGVAYNENPPLGCLYLASAVRQQGHHVSFYDQGAPENRLRYPSPDRIDQIAPDVVGVSLYTFGLPQALAFIADLKRSRPDMLVVAGGHHATALPERTLQDAPGIDYLVCGEGEVTFNELLRALQAGRSVASVPGLCYRGTDEIVRTSPRPLITDLDSVPFPANDLIQQTNYTSENIRVGRKILNLTSSRGCPFHCTYCNKAVHGSVYRRRSPANVVEEIETMFQAFEYDEVMFHDELFTADRRWLREFLDLLDKRNLKYPWRCLCRVGTVNTEELVRMRAHGCYMAAFGLEAGNPRVREDLNRKMTNEAIVSSFRMARKAGMILYAFNMINHRLDTPETIRDTYNLMKEVGAEFSPVFVCSPLPGSKIYEELPEAIKYDWDRFNSYRDFKAVPISISRLREEDLNRLASQMEVFYYARFSYLFRNVLRVGTPFRLRLFLLRVWIRSFLVREQHLAGDDWFVDGRSPGKGARWLHGLMHTTLAGLQKWLQTLRRRTSEVKR